MTTARDRIREDAGFTLVELLVAMTITLVIAFAALGAFEVFDRGNASNNRLTDGEDSARRVVGTMVRSIRDAGVPAPAEGAQPVAVIRNALDDLVFLSTSFPGETSTSSGTHLLRYCASDELLYFGSNRADGISDGVEPGACGASEPGWTYSVLAKDVLNSGDLFSYAYSDSDSSPHVTSVRIALRLETGTADTGRPLPLGSGATLRGALASAIDDDDIDDGGCEAPGKRLFEVGIDPDTGERLPFELSEIVEGQAAAAIDLGFGRLLVDTTISDTITLRVTDAFGIDRIIQKQVPACP